MCDYTLLLYSDGVPFSNETEAMIWLRDSFYDYGLKVNAAKISPSDSNPTLSYDLITPTSFSSGKVMYQVRRKQLSMFYSFVVLTLLCVPSLLFRGTAREPQEPLASLKVGKEPTGMTPQD